MRLQVKETAIFRRVLTFDRYSPMVDHSPFAIATAVALPAATPDFAKDLYVANVEEYTPGGDLVTIASSSDHNFKKCLYYMTESVDGYRVVCELSMVRSGRRHESDH